MFFETGMANQEWLKLKTDENKHIFEMVSLLKQMQQYGVNCIPNAQGTVDVDYRRKDALLQSLPKDLVSKINWVDFSAMFEMPTSHEMH